MEGEIRMPKEYFTVQYEEPTPEGYYDVEKKFFTNELDAKNYFKELLDSLKNEEPSEGAAITLRGEDHNLIEGVDATEYFETKVKQERG